MAAATLIWRPTIVHIATVAIDASEHEKHSTQVDITDSPVEQGADVSDSLRKKPQELTITGIVSNFVIAGGPSQTIVVSNEDAEPDSDFQFLSSSSWAQGRAEEAYATLEGLAGSSTLFQVVTSLRVYDNMALKSLEVPRDATTGHALRFTATFKELIIVNNATVQIAVSQPSAVPTKNVGKTAAVPESTAHAIAHSAAAKAVAAKVKSLL